MTPTASADPHRSVSSPQEDAGENIALEQAGLIDSTLAAANANESIAEEPPASAGEESKDRPVAGEATEKEKLERGKIRRSIHRTLRDAHVPSQHRSRKEKHSSTGAKDADEMAKDDHLARGTGSFVIHGKKASVITFGDALAGMSAEERMRARKGERGGSRSPGGETSLRGGDRASDRDRAGGAAAADHRGSEASTNTVAARSFRELHNRLSAHAATLESGEEGGGADSDALSVLTDEGARTPLAPVEDVEEDEEVGGHKQAAFYTPEVPGTPAKE
ncbi:hypothetical protein V495_08263 [Pseudogymnoascus sp. VKM F-4514 (FW-929)]|nr:hypothetical protein V495_08263 [Pseudogymnoascus sp. VKM F-4514 (FW-929)]